LISESFFSTAEIFGFAGDGAGIRNNGNSNVAVFDLFSSSKDKTCSARAITSAGNPANWAT